MFPNSSQAGKTAKSDFRAGIIFAKVKISEPKNQSNSPLAKNVRNAKIQFIRKDEWKNKRLLGLAGNRNTDGTFNNLGTNANFWSSTVSGSNAWNRNLNYTNATVNRNENDQANGFSVRCLKDWLSPSIFLRFPMGSGGKVEK